MSDSRSSIRESLALGKSLKSTNTTINRGSIFDDGALSSVKASTIELLQYYDIVKPHLASFLSSKLKDPRLDFYELLFYSQTTHPLFELARKRNMNGIVSSIIFLDYIHATIELMLPPNTF